VSGWPGGTKDARSRTGWKRLSETSFRWLEAWGQARVGVGESRQPATHPLDQLVWAVWTVRAEPAKLIRLLLLRPTLMLPPRGIKADAWPPGEPRIRALVVMPHSPPSGKGARRITGAPVPNPQITRETRVTLQRLASGVSKANEDRALWFLALLSKALYDKLMPMNSDPSLLRAALVGYENQLQKIDQAISDLRQRLHLAPASASQPASGRLRTLSAGARRRIAAAQKKRWAAYRKSKGAGK